VCASERLYIKSPFCISRIISLFLFFTTYIMELISGMVNADRVKRKLPCLLCDCDTGKRESNNAFMRNRYWLQQFKSRKPQRFDTLTSELIFILVKIEKEMKK
jgi:hypothetical protein